ncbi:uncharacterized protein LOC106661925 isoform X2 [Cimex lectularius]|uniref:Uncharacterized protein n=1 Tax=Cimex lectularius TaxID=79782 RepID=A0A8I6RC38_CIMLE|nr:uncharacterized protein LOC106661925 isoform X2 [Cimex lectularius]
MREMPKMELKRASQDSSISSSEESIAGFSEKPSSEVDALVYRLKKSANDKNNIPIKAQTEDEKLRQVFPWVDEFQRHCKRQMGIKNIHVLENLMSTYIGNIATSVIGCYGKPNRATRLKRTMSDTLLLFHMIHTEIKQPLEQSSYLDKMSDLLAYYIDMEIKASKRGKENIAKIGCKITNSLFLFLDRSQDHILDTILKTKLMMAKCSWELCTPIFNRVLMVSPGQEIFELTYTRYILVFKMWKKCMKKAEDRRKIMTIATNRLTPPENFPQKIKTGVLRGVLPRIPKSRTDVTMFLMQAKFCVKTKTAEFFKAISDPKHSIVLNEHLPVHLDKPLFFEDDNDVDNDNCDDQDDANGSNGLMNDIWSSLCLKTNVRDRIRVANVLKTPVKKVPKLLKSIKKKKKKSEKVMKQLNAKMTEGLVAENDLESNRSPTKNQKTDNNNTLVRTLEKLKSNCRSALGGEQGVITSSTKDDNVSDDDVIIIEDARIKSENMTPIKLSDDENDPKIESENVDQSALPKSPPVNIHENSVKPEHKIDGIKIKKQENIVNSASEIKKDPDVRTETDIDPVETCLVMTKEGRFSPTDDDTLVDVENIDNTILRKSEDTNFLPESETDVMPNSIERHPHCDEYFEKCKPNVDLGCKNTNNEMNQEGTDHFNDCPLPTDFSQKTSYKEVSPGHHLSESPIQFNQQCANTSYNTRFKTPAELKEGLKGYEFSEHLPERVPMRVVEPNNSFKIGNEPQPVNDIINYTHSSTENMIKPLSLIQPSLVSQKQDNGGFRTPAQLKEGLVYSPGTVKNSAKTSTEENLAQVGGEILSNNVRENYPKSYLPTDLPCQKNPTAEDTNDSKLTINQHQPSLDNVFWAGNQGSQLSPERGNVMANYYYSNNMNNGYAVPTLFPFDGVPTLERGDAENEPYKAIENPVIPEEDLFEPMFDIRPQVIDINPSQSFTNPNHPSLFLPPFTQKQNNDEKDKSIESDQEDDTKSEDIINFNDMYSLWNKDPSPIKCLDLEESKPKKLKSGTSRPAPRRSTRQRKAVQYTPQQHKLYNGKSLKRPKLSPEKGSKGIDNSTSLGLSLMDLDNVDGWDI